MRIGGTTHPFLALQFLTGGHFLFHRIGALSQFGKLGLTAIGNSPEQADAIYARALEVLDRESHR